jgi:hypothetical protein
MREFRVSMLLANFTLACSVPLLIADSSLGGTSPPACAAPEYRSFDFWIGKWDVYDVGGTSIVAHADVRLILDGCVLLEEFRGSAGHEGRSFTIYDSSRKVWHQTWVTNAGQLLVIEGQARDGLVELSGTERQSSGVERWVKGTWRINHDVVRETALRSMNKGKTWEQWFDVEFRLRR